MLNIYIVILIPFLILVLIYFFNKRTRKYINDKYPELIVNIIIVIWSVFIGAFYALKITSDASKENDIENYKAILNSCKKLNDQYINDVKDIIDSLNTRPSEVTKMDRLISSANLSFMIEELIKKNDLYYCASTEFKNWLPQILTFLKTTDWTISKDNIEVYRYNYQYLLYIKQLILNELQFLSEGMSENQIHELNYHLRENHSDSTFNINTDDIIILHTKDYFEDSLEVERKYFK